MQPAQAGAPGCSLGTVLSGLPTAADGHFIGSPWIWLNWSSLVVALTLIQGYVLIASTYLILKTSGELQRLHVRTARLAAATTLIVQLFCSLAIGQEVWPFVYTVLLFVLSFAGLGVMVFPAIIPPSVTILEASSSVTSMGFMLTFIGVLIPIMLFYNIYNCIAFSGKVDAELDKA